MYSLQKKLERKEGATEDIKFMTLGILTEAMRRVRRISEQRLQR